MRVIRCDVINCQNTATEDEFTLQGWSRTDGHDLCPQCSAAYKERKDAIDRQYDTLSKDFFRRRIEIKRR